MSRLESGHVQFGEDWPGFFLRGDNAGSFGMQITAILTHYKEVAGDRPDFLHLDVAQVGNLAKKLKATVARPQCQMMKSYDECNQKPSETPTEPPYTPPGYDYGKEGTS